jgi:hypothetical protein
MVTRQVLVLPGVRLEKKTYSTVEFVACLSPRGSTRLFCVESRIKRRVGLSSLSSRRLHCVLTAVRCSIDALGQGRQESRGHMARSFVRAQSAAPRAHAPPQVLPHLTLGGRLSLQSAPGQDQLLRSGGPLLTV